MLSLEEVAAMEDARSAAVKAGAAARARADQSWIGSLMFPNRDTRAADAIEASISAIDGVRNGLVERPDDDHEAVLGVVQDYRELADPAFLARFAATATTVGDKVSELHLPNVPSLDLGALKPWLIGAGVLVGLVAVAWLASSASKFRGLST